MTAAREALLSSLRSVQDSPGSIENFYSTAALSGLAFSREGYMEAVEQVTLEDMVKNSEIIKLIQQRIDELQKGLASFEQIKKFTLLPREFSMELGELTNTLKIRRLIIAKHFAGEIEAMYV